MEEVGIFFKEDVGNVLFVPRVLDLKDSSRKEEEKQEAQGPHCSPESYRLIFRIYM
jgi:hypothetical protein